MSASNDGHLRRAIKDLKAQLATAQAALREAKQLIIEGLQERAAGIIDAALAADVEGRGE